MRLVLLVRLIPVFFLCGGTEAFAQASAATNSAPGTRASAAQPTRPAGRLRPLSVTLNLSPVGEWTLFENEEGLFATPDMLTEWRLVVPSNMPTLTFRGQSWLPLYVLPGYRARIDTGNQSLELEFLASAFVGTQVSNPRQALPTLSPKLPSAFVNYDVSYTRSTSTVPGAGSTSSQQTGVLSELGLSYGPGVLVSSFIGRGLGSNDPLVKPEWRRLETTWTLDQPESNRTVRLGDTSTRASLWGRSVYYGGFQIGTNFGLTPGFLTQPIPAVAGTANGPSTVELYVNDVLRQTANVPAGPFTVENFNQVTAPVKCAWWCAMCLAAKAWSPGLFSPTRICSARIWPTGASTWAACVTTSPPSTATIATGSPLACTAAVCPMR